MLKQHCDICDGIIPGDESFRVIRYGRGQNLDVQTGNNPKIICKECWKKMWAAVKPNEEVKNIDNIEAEFLSKAEAERIQKSVNKNSDAINGIHDILKEMTSNTLVQVKQVGHNPNPMATCTSCKYCDRGSMENPCNICLGRDKWEAKDNG